MRIAIASGKGGTGKTTLAVNLASMLSEQFPQKHIVLVDLDVEEPNSGLFLDRKPVFNSKITRTVPGWVEENCSFCGNCQAICNFSAIAKLPERILILPELCHSCHACIDLCPERAISAVEREIGSLTWHKQNKMDFVESHLRIGEPSAVSLISQVKEFCSSNFNENSTYIFDCPPGNSCPVIEAVKDADFVILVTEPTPFGLHDLQVASETMKKLELNYGVVINKSGLGEDMVSGYCRENDISILGDIKHQRVFAESSASGQMLYSRFLDFKKSLNTIYFNIPK